MNIKQLQELCETVGDKFIMRTTTGKIVVNCSVCKIDYFIEEEKYTKAATKGKIACPICKKLDQLHQQDLK